MHALRKLGASPQYLTDMVNPKRIVQGVSPVLLSILVVSCATSEKMPEDPYNPRIELVLQSAMQPSDEPAPAVVSDFAMDTDAGFMRIHSLNIGAGSCHIIECPGPGNNVVVFDCGTIDRTPNDMVDQEIADYGADIFSGSDDITVFTSHPDRDHYTLIHRLLGDQMTDSVWLGGEADRYSTNSFIDWLLGQQNNGVPVFHDFPEGFANSGLPLSQVPCGAASLYFLTANVGSSKNANSIGLLVYYSGFKALFPGDAQGVTQESIMSNFGALTNNVDLLFGSHHGSSSHQSNKGAWPDHVNPRIVIYSSGDEFKHPKCSIVGNYRNRLLNAASHPVWCDPIDNSSQNTTESVNFAEYVTEVSGVVVVETNGSDISISCSRQPGGCF